MLESTLSGSLIRQARSPSRAQSPSAHGQQGLLLLLVMLTGIAWLLTLAHGQSSVTPFSHALHDGSLHHLDGPGLGATAQLAASGMAGTEWSVAGLAAFVVAWSVMMTAMMFPGLTPMLLTMHAIALHRQGRRGALRTTAVFVGGYLLVWTGVGCLTWAIVRTLGQIASHVDAAQRAHWAPLLLGGTLIVAGLYQLTPFKQMCLDHCRSPFIVVMQRWREGFGGALKMGIGHGLYCLGCCWALFTVLVAAGIMSLAWMLALTLIDSAEKTLPLGRQAARAVGVGFVFFGIAMVMRTISLAGAA